MDVELFFNITKYLLYSSFWVYQGCTFKSYFKRFAFEVFCKFRLISRTKQKGQSILASRACDGFMRNRKIKYLLFVDGNENEILENKKSEKKPFAQTVRRIIITFKEKETLVKPTRSKVCNTMHAFVFKENT